MRQSNLLRHFFKTEKLLISFGFEIPCVLTGLSQTYELFRNGKICHVYDF